MTDPRPFEELVDPDEVPAVELERLRRMDALLRTIPAPAAEVPAALSSAVVTSTVRPPSAWTRRRSLAAVALAATLAALFFGLGRWSEGRETFEAQAAVELRATEDARGAEALIRVGEADASGNVPLRLEVSGLPRLPEGGYYALWLAKDGEYGATCGSFRMGAGETEAEWTVSYRLDDYDEWVVTAYLPDEPRDVERPWLLRAPVDSAL